MKIKKLLTIFLSLIIFNPYALALELVGVKQPDGSVVYSGNFPNPGKAVCGANWGGTIDYEIRYRRLVPDYLPYFTLKVEASSPITPMKQINGNWQQGQRVKADGTGSYITLKLTLIPPNNGVFNSNILKAGHQLLDGQMEMHCIFSSGVNFRKTTFSLTAANDIELDRTCELALDADRAVGLEPIFLNTLKNNNQVYGGEFPIQLNCNNATAESAYISYTDGIVNSNTSTILNTDASSGSATGVGLKIYDGDNSNSAISYTPPFTDQFISLTGNNNIHIFANNTNNGGLFSKTYKVYYAKTSNNVTAGSVTGRLVYNIYYR